METTHLKFNSMIELGETVQHLIDIKAPRTHNSSTNGDADYGRMSMADAVAMACSGGNWQEGANKMPSVNIEHNRVNGAAMDTPTIENCMEGFAPNVGAYLSGAPDNMMSFTDTPQGDKLLRVAVHVGRIYSTKQHQILNRGAAIMAVLDQLSREGYNIELWALWRNSLDDQCISVETCVKHGNDFWTPSSVAFALCHAAFQRRLCWYLAETVTPDQPGSKLPPNGYGNGMKATYHDYDLAFGYVDKPGKFDTLEKAIETVKRQTLNQLNKLESAA